MQLQTTIQTTQRSQQEERSFSTARDRELSNERKTYPLSNLSFDDADISTLRTVMPLQSAIFYWEFVRSTQFLPHSTLLPVHRQLFFYRVILDIPWWLSFRNVYLLPHFHQHIDLLRINKNNFHRSLCLLHLLTEQRLILDTKDLVIVISWRYLLL